MRLALGVYVYEGRVGSRLGVLSAARNGWTIICKEQSLFDLGYVPLSKVRQKPLDKKAGEGARIAE
jgi:hypothetical protein